MSSVRDGAVSPPCAIDGDTACKDSWSSVIFASRSTRDALYSLRACIEEPALHVYSQLSSHTTHTTLQCMSYSDGVVFEVAVDIYRVTLPGWPSAFLRRDAARTYMASFRVVPDEDEVTEEVKWTLVQKLVRRAQQTMWAEEMQSRVHVASTRRDT